MNLLLSAADLLSKELELLFGTGLLRDWILLQSSVGILTIQSQIFSFCLTLVISGLCAILLLCIDGEPGSRAGGALP